MSDENRPDKSLELYQVSTFLERHPVLQQMWGDSMSSIRGHYGWATLYGLFSFLASVYFGLSTASTVNIIYCVLVTFGVPLVLIFVKNYIYAPAKVMQKLKEQLDEEKSVNYQLKAQVTRLSPNPKKNQELTKPPEIIEQPQQEEKQTIPEKKLNKGNKIEYGLKGLAEIAKKKRREKILQESIRQEVLQFIEKGVKEERALSRERLDAGKIQINFKQGEPFVETTPLPSKTMRKLYVEVLNDTGEPIDNVKLSLLEVIEKDIGDKVLYPKWSGDVCRLGQTLEDKEKRLFKFAIQYSDKPQKIILAYRYGLKTEYVTGLEFSIAVSAKDRLHFEYGNLKRFVMYIDEQDLLQLKEIEADIPVENFNSEVLPSQSPSVFDESKLTLSLSHKEPDTTRTNRVLAISLLNRTGKIVSHFKGSMENVIETEAHGYKPMNFHSNPHTTEKGIDIGTLWNGQSHPITVAIQKFAEPLDILLFHKCPPLVLSKVRRIA